MSNHEIELYCGSWFGRKTLATNSIKNRASYEIFSTIQLTPVTPSGKISRTLMTTHHWYEGSDVILGVTCMKLYRNRELSHYSKVV